MEQEIHNPESAQVPRKLPLWKSFLEETPIDYGYTIEADALARELGVENIDCIEYAMAVNQIRKELRKRGMVFTARGQQGERYVVTPPATNQAEINRLQRSAISAMKQGVILGTNTPLDMLTEAERRSHEAITEKLGLRLALVTRAIPRNHRESRDRAESINGLIQ